MPYSVRYLFPIEASGAPLESIGRVLQDIAEAVDSVPPASPFWPSMHHSTLQIDVEGWRVLYRVAHRAREILAVEVSQIPAKAH